MHRFYAERLSDTRALLPEDERRHAQRVLRLQAGDGVILLCDGALLSATLLENGECEITGELPSTEAKTRVTLYQGIPKGDKMDFIAQKCTEAGVCRIVPVRMSRCVPDGDIQKKLERWRRIAREAAKQAFRAAPPDIEDALPLPALPGRLRAHELAIVPWEEARGVSIADALTMQTASDIAIVIVPEGGLDAQADLAPLVSADAVPVTLGPRIFRTETAGLAAAVAIFALKGDMA